jgi:2-polyprenyl-3-methyl-5-hydroxy-6-metoxy-1,4-benzoquinol methylase
MLIDEQNAKSCPACGCGDWVQIGDPAPSFSVAVGERCFHQPNYIIRKCSNCSLHYKSNTCPPSELSDYYSRLEFESYEYAGLFPTDREVIKLLDALPDKTPVLDFGCGVGRILASSVTRLNCHGIEVNQRASDQAASRGIVIYTEAELLASPQRKFGMIILTDVFEHLVDPFTLLKNLSELLATGGQLVIVTGNADGIPDTRYSSHFWYYRILGHLQMLSTGHLEWLAEQLDLRLGTVIRTCHYEWPLKTRIKQQAQSWAFDTFKLRPTSWTARALSRVPILAKARGWQLAPAYSMGQDHLVAPLIKR